MSWNRSTWHDATQSAISQKSSGTQGEMLGDLFYEWGEHMHANGTEQHDNYWDAFEAYADDVSDGVEEMGMNSTRKRS